jgi:hypothetical protein
MGGTAIFIGEIEIDADRDKQTRIGLNEWVESTI